MMTSENALPGGSDRAWDIAKAATAELDGHGRVVAWTRAAERLLGYRPRRSCTTPPRSCWRYRATRCGWPPWRGGAGRGTAGAARSRRATGTAGICSWRCRSRPLLDGAGQERWSVLALEEWRMPGGGVNQLMLEPFLAHAPVGMAVLDTGLRYVWVNDVLERLIPLDQRLGSG